MVLEYILLLTIFALTFGPVLWTGPGKAFKNGGPRLGARVERSLVTGNGFHKKGNVEPWLKP